MSKVLFDARANISKVSQLLRSENYIPALQSLYDGVYSMSSEPLLQSEKHDFTALVKSAISEISHNKFMLTVASVGLTYTPGDETELLGNLRMLIDSLSTVAAEKAAVSLEEREQDKKRKFEKACAELKEGNIDRANGLFNNLMQNYKSDIELTIRVAGVYEEANCLVESSTYLIKACDQDPSSIVLHNRTGTMLRKIKKYSEAEKYLLKLITITPRDPNVFFNLGRVYLDCQRWADAERVALSALGLKPDFIEATKMKSYAQSKQAEKDETNGSK